MTQPVYKIKLLQFAEAFKELANYECLAGKCGHIHPAECRRDVFTQIDQLDIQCDEAIKAHERGE